MYNPDGMKASTVVNGEAAAAAATAPVSQSDAGGTDPGDADLLRAYRCMLLSRKIDDKEIQLKNQSKTFFQISGAGHEAVLVAAGMVLRPGYDWFFPYYRDRALCLQLGVKPLDMLLAAVGSKNDPSSGGRQMPSHWGAVALNIVSGSSATGMKVLHAVGAAEAGVIYDRVDAIPDRASRYRGDEVVYVSLGDGTTSEGEFWEALNAACLKRLPVLFLVEDNGYAISVPVEVQTAGGDISRLVRGFPGLHVEAVDGTDFLASHRAMRAAAAHVRGRKGPALVHAHVTRPYSHSLSDDEKLYKTPAERANEQSRDPISRFADVLRARGAATDADLSADARFGRSRGQRGRAGGSSRAEARAGHRHAVGVLARRRSRPRRPSTRRHSTRARPTRWWPPSTARSGTRWRTTRASSSSARMWRTAAGGKRSTSCPARAACSS